MVRETFSRMFPENAKATPRLAFSCLKSNLPARMVWENATRWRKTLRCGGGFGVVINSGVMGKSSDLEPLYLTVGSIRTTLTGFPAQSVRSSNTYALDSLYLLVLNTGMSQSRQHDMSELDSYYLSD
ncbi:hypothetical protein Tco_1058994 [Tanacetum coccineum]